jgi:ABC-type phosphate/phosphonate transport system permease subunit
MDGLGKNQKLAPSLLCVAGLFAFIGSSSAWIRVSFIQIRGLDYWFGFVTAISACAIITAGITNLRPLLVTPKWRKNWTIYSLLTSIASITILLIVATRVNKIGEEISKKAELPDSFVGGLLLGVLGRVIGKATKTVAEFIEPKLAEGFYITIMSFFLAAIVSMYLAFIDAKNKSRA